MKTSKTTGLLVLIAVICSACNLGGEANLSVYDYVLNLSFQDANGNSLALEIAEGLLSDAPNSDLYVLDIIVSEPCSNWDNRIYNAPARPGFIPDVHRPKLYTRADDYGNVYLSNSLSIPVSGCPPQEILTYKLQCPHLFGDNEIREFVTYWDIPQKLSKTGSNYINCTRIEFEGQIIIPTHEQDPKLLWRNNNEAIVVLNN